MSFDKFDKKFKHLEGKKVKCVCKGETYIGVLQFAGINTLLHNEFQVTLGRMPLWPVDPKTIKLYENDNQKIVINEKNQN